MTHISGSKKKKKKKKEKKKKLTDLINHLDVWRGRSKSVTVTTVYICHLCVIWDLMQIKFMLCYVITVIVLRAFEYDAATVCPYLCTLTILLHLKKIKRLFAKVPQYKFWRKQSWQIRDQRTIGPVSFIWDLMMCWIRTSLEIRDYMLYKLSPMQKN